MRLFFTSFAILTFSVGLAPIVHAQTICNEANNFACPSGQTCSDYPSGICVAVPQTQAQTGAGNSQVQVGAGNPNNTANTGTNVTLINPLNSGNCAPNENCLLNFLNKILDFVIQIGTVVVILMLVYVGYLFVVARGDPTKLTTARQALLWTIVGALILLGSKAIAIGITETVKALSVGK